MAGQQKNAGLRFHPRLPPHRFLPVAPRRCRGGRACRLSNVAVTRPMLFVRRMPWPAHRTTANFCLNLNGQQTSRESFIRRVRTPKVLAHTIVNWIVSHLAIRVRFLRRATHARPQHLLHIAHRSIALSRIYRLHHLTMIRHGHPRRAVKSARSAWTPCEQQVAGRPRKPYRCGTSMCSRAGLRRPWERRGSVIALPRYGRPVRAAVPEG